MRTEMIKIHETDYHNAKLFSFLFGAFVILFTIFLIMKSVEWGYL